MKTISALLLSVLCGGCATQPNEMSELRQVRPITRSEIIQLPSRISVERLVKRLGPPSGFGRECILVYKSDQPGIDFLVFFGPTYESEDMTEAKKIMTYEMPSHRSEIIWEWNPHAGVIRRKK